MKIIVTTSNAHLHLLKIFCYLFNKFWDRQQQVEIVGYNKPDFKLPDNFTFYSLGIQSDDKRNFTRDLRKYFALQGQYFIWMMEDSFIRSKVDLEKLEFLYSLVNPTIGRINLTDEVMKQEYKDYFIKNGILVLQNTQTARYRLSTQPSIWNKDFVLKYMQEDLNPWEFETQPSINDGCYILGIDPPAVIHNEGVRRFDLYAYNFHAFDNETLEELKEIV